MGSELIRARWQGVLDDTDDWNEEEFQAIYGSIFSFAIRQLDEQLVREYSATPQAAAAAACSGEEPQTNPRRTAAQVKEDMRAVHRERMRRKFKDRKAAAATERTE